MDNEKSIISTTTINNINNNIPKSAPISTKTKYNKCIDEEKTSEKTIDKNSDIKENFSSVTQSKINTIINNGCVNNLNDNCIVDDINLSSCSSLNVSESATAAALATVATVPTESNHKSPSKTTTTTTPIKKMVSENSGTGSTAGTTMTTKNKIGGSENDQCNGTVNTSDDSVDDPETLMSISKKVKNSYQHSQSLPRPINDNGDDDDDNDDNDDDDDDDEDDEKVPIINDSNRKKSYSDVSGGNGDNFSPTTNKLVSSNNDFLGLLNKKSDNNKDHNSKSTISTKNFNDKSMPTKNPSSSSILRPSLIRQTVPPTPPPQPSSPLNKLLSFKLSATSVNDESVSATSTDEAGCCGGSENNDDIKPLLQKHDSEKRKFPIIKRGGIVKSPSSKSFGIDSSTTNDGENNVEQQRPVLHVQFSQNGDYQQSSSTPTTMMYGALNTGDSEIGECAADGGSNPASSVSSTSSSSRNSDDEDDDDDDDDDENSSSGQYSEARPPDGGWGWVVVFASFMVNLIGDGITFSFGVIYVEFLNYFGESKGKTAWIGSVFMAMPLLSGPIASFLTDRYGCRRVTIAGSILACIGFVISSFSQSMEMLFLTFGILAGFGLSLCYVAAVVIVAYYFDKRRSLATGLSVCGSGIGTFVFAPLTQVLIENYGWRGTTLILAGFFLNMCVCGMLMRDLEWTTHRAKLRAKKRKQQTNKLGISAESFSVSNSTNTGGTASNLHQQQQQQQQQFNIIENIDPSSVNARMFSSLITLPTFMRNGEKVPLEVLELMATHRNVQHLINNEQQSNLAHSRSFSEPLSSSRHNGISPPPEGALSPTNPERIRYEKSKNCQIKNEQAFLTWLNRDGAHQQRFVSNRHPTTAYLKDLKMHRHSLTYRGAMLNINRYRLRASSCPDIYRNSMTTIAKEKVRWDQGLEDFKHLLLDMLDFSYFADIRFVLFALSNFFLYTWYDVPYVYLADNAIGMGTSEKDASMLISFIGIINMVGEIFLGWWGDRKYLSAGVTYAICMGLCGVVTALVPILKTYAGLAVAAGLFGLFIGANYALTSIILVELITLERFTNAYGLLLLVQGVANLVGPPLAGWITDATGSYDLAFYISGVFIVLSGLLMFILPIQGKVKKCKSNRRRKNQDREAAKAQDNKHNGKLVPETMTTTTTTAGGATITTTATTEKETKTPADLIFGDCFGNKNLLKRDDSNSQINHV